MNPVAGRDARAPQPLREFMQASQSGIAPALRPTIGGLALRRISQFYRASVRLSG